MIGVEGGVWMCGGDDSKRNQIQGANAKAVAVEAKPVRRQAKFMHLFCIQGSPPRYSEVID